jgi:hypothetical protein
LKRFFWSSLEMSEWWSRPFLELVEHHERVDAAALVDLHERVRDLVLDVAGRDPLHALAVGLVAQLLDVVLGVAGQRLAVVELQLLHQREVGLLRLLEARQHRPHRRDLQRVGRDVLAADPLGVVVPLVDLALVVEPHVVRDVDLQGAVAEGFHELVVLEPLVLRLVGSGR